MLEIAFFTSISILITIIIILIILISILLKKLKNLNHNIDNNIEIIKTTKQYSKEIEETLYNLRKKIIGINEESTESTRLSTEKQKILDEMKRR